MSQGAICDGRFPSQRWKKARNVSLNIKREETYRSAQELAHLTVESVTTAATGAVRERLDRVHRQQDSESLADRLLAIGEDCAAHLNEPYRSSSHADLLYDERGLPR